MSSTPTTGEVVRFCRSQGRTWTQIDSIVDQIAWSHHWTQAGDKLVHHSAPYRYVWPPELDLMVHIAGLLLRARWSGWDGAPYVDGSVDHIAVYEKARRLTHGSRPALRRHHI